jgi:transcription initiation factor TFIIIB Brf1 subunit/transcription initiation factor TFIIB
MDCPHADTFFDDISAETVCNNCGEVLRRSLYVNEGAVACTDPVLPNITARSFFNGNGHSALKRIQAWTCIPPKERALAGVFSLIDTALEGTPYNQKIADDARIFYYTVFNTGKELHNDVLARGDTRLGLVAYCVYAACMHNGALIDNETLAAIFGISVKSLQRGKKRYLEIARARGVQSSGQKSAYTIDDYARQYINRMPDISHEQAEVIVVAATKAGAERLFMNHRPQTSAAGLCYYFITGVFGMSGDVLADISGRAVVTLRKVASEVDALAPYLVPHELKGRGSV